MSKKKKNNLENINESNLYEREKLSALIHFGNLNGYVKFSIDSSLNATLILTKPDGTEYSLNGTLTEPDEPENDTLGGE